MKGEKVPRDHIQSLAKAPWLRDWASHPSQKEKISSPKERQELRVEQRQKERLSRDSLT